MPVFPYVTCVLRVIFMDRELDRLMSGGRAAALPVTRRYEPRSVPAVWTDDAEANDTPCGGAQADPSQRPDTVQLDVQGRMYRGGRRWIHGLVISAFMKLRSLSAEPNPPLLLFMRSTAGLYIGVVLKIHGGEFFVKDISCNSKSNC